MLKKLHFKSWLLMLCMLLGVGNAWADKITDYSDIVSGQAYYIGATVGGTDYYLGLASTDIGNGILGQKKTSKDDATLFIFEGSDATWTIQISGTENYMALASSKNNGKVNVVDEASEWTLSADGSLIKMVNNNYWLRANSSSSLNFGSYASGQTAVWLEAAAAADQSQSPSISGDVSFLNSTTVTITAAEGATIYYTLDGNDPTTSSTQYTGAFTLTETTTVKAIAVESGKDPSDVSSKLFTKQAVKANLAALIADNETGFVQLTDALVTYVNNGKGYIQDASAGMYLYGCAGELAVGDQISGIMNVTGYTVYNNLPEVTSFALVDGYTKTSGNTVTAEEVTLEDLIADYDNYLSRYVVIKGATVQSAFSSKNSTIEQNGSTIVMRDQNSSATLTSTVDDVVDVYCHPAIFSVTKQLSVWEQSQIVVNTVQLLDNVITVTGGTEKSIDTNSEYELTLSATATSGEAVTFTVDATATTLTEGVDFEFVNGNTVGIIQAKAGTIVIKANSAATSEYKAADEVTITITVIGAKQDPSIVVADAPVPFGSTFTVDDSVIEGGEITVTSSNEAVATVDGLVITPAAVGTTTITVATAEDATYKAGSETFTLTVTAPEGKTEAPSAIGGAVFTETFAESTGSISNNFSASDGSGTFAADNTWTVENAYGAGAAAKFGASKKKGTATTPAISVTEGTSYTLTFKAAPWASESSTMSVTVTGGTISGISTDEMTTGEWNDYEATVTATAESLTIKFEASNNRFFLDEVVLAAPGSAAATETVTLNTYGYKTLCSEYPLDFSDRDADETYTAWELTDIASEGVITFNQITTAIKGGQGILLKGAAGADIEIPMADGAEELTNNLLEGTLAPTYIGEEKYYALSGNTFVKVHEGVVPAGKAILDADWVSVVSSAKSFTFVFNSADGIQIIEKVSAEEAAKIFDLAGRRLSQTRKGVNIVNGKKILVK